MSAAVPQRRQTVCRCCTHTRRAHRWLETGFGGRILDIEPCTIPGCICPNYVGVGYTENVADPMGLLS